MPPEQAAEVRIGKVSPPRKTLDVVPPQRMPAYPLGDSEGQPPEPLPLLLSIPPNAPRAFSAAALRVGVHAAGAIGLHSPL